MEATEEQASGLLHKIIPPRLEDAGLEDCALAPDSIKEAFLRAATAVKSRAVGIWNSDDEGDCVADPWPDAADRSDVVVGGSSVPDESPGPCAVVKGGGETVDTGGDDVVVVGGGGEEEAGDEVVVGSEGEVAEKDCVDGLRGLEIGDEKEKEKKKKKNGGDDEKNGDDDEEMPILLEVMSETLAHLPLLVSLNVVKIRFTQCQ